jgi:GntR family transcriptional regulator
MLELSVDPRSGYPIYLQIVEQVQRSIAIGTAVPGEQLPTVKQLAKVLVVNPSTVARALRELEHLGLVDSLPGRGSWVKTNGSTRAAERAVEETVAKSLADAVKDARALGVSVPRLRTLFAGAVLATYGDDEHA